MPAKAKGDDSCHHTSILFSTDMKSLDPVMSVDVDTLPSTGATGKVFSVGTPELDSHGPVRMMLKNSLQTQLDHLVGGA